MIDLVAAHWGQILAVLSIVMGAAAAIHAAMTKEDVRAAIGWVGVIILSPIIGAVLYAVAGINRIRRASSARSATRSFARMQMASSPASTPMAARCAGGSAIVSVL